MQLTYNYITILLMIKIIVLVIVVPWILYRNLSTLDFRKLINAEELEYPQRLINCPGFKNSFLAIHDPEFMDHYGYSLVNDLVHTAGALTGRDISNQTLTRKIASRFKTEDRLSGFYTQYLIPVKLESEFEKIEILKLSLATMERRAGVSYKQLLKTGEFGDCNELGWYEWILMHSLITVYSNSENSAQQVEKIFIDYLSRIKANRVIRDSTVKEVLKDYKNNFLNDLKDFLCINNSAYTKRKHWPASWGGVMAYADLIYFYANKHQISFPLFLAIVQSESAGNPKAISSANALGLAQIILPTGRMITDNPHLTQKDLFDPHTNLDTAARYIQLNKSRIDQHFSNLSQSKRVRFIAASYNAGWQRVKKASGIPNISETQVYSSRVLRYYQFYSQKLPEINQNISVAMRPELCIEAK